MPLENLHCEILLVTFKYEITLCRLLDATDMLPSHAPYKLFYCTVYDLICIHPGRPHSMHTQLFVHPYRPLNVCAPFNSQYQTEILSVTDIVHLLAAAGQGFKGDIAVDDITYSPSGPCSSLLPATTSRPDVTGAVRTTPHSSSFDCNFDDRYVQSIKLLVPVNVWLMAYNSRSARRQHQLYILRDIQ